MKSISNSGIHNIEIYRTCNRLIMVMETDDDFSFESKAAMESTNQLGHQWEELMWKFQQPLPWAEQREKWILMNRIFQL